VDAVMTEFFHVLNVYKPLAMTSHDVVDVVRKVYGLKKVGHMGTLDPMAEGVLPVALGKATRLLEYFFGDKQYLVEVTLGIETTTLDQEGDVTHKEPCPQITQAMVEALLPQFTGLITQEVPIYSAKRVNGKKLYELARQNIPIDLPVKTVEVFAISVTQWDTTDPNHPKVTLAVHCSSGTFMRAIARDMGKALGCGAHMSALTRTAHGRFEASTAVILETLTLSGDPQSFLAAPTTYLNLPVLAISADEVQRVHQGMKIAINNRIPPGLKCLHDKELVLLTADTGIVAVTKAQPQTNQLKPVKVFH